MARFDKDELATRFYVDGSECIKSAELLFTNKQRGARSQYGILLIHGIELLLKSYLLLKNKKLPDDPNEIDKYLKGLGHRYNDIYTECLLYGAELDSPHLKAYLNGLGNLYYADSVGVRYVQESGLTIFPPDIFSIIRTELIKSIYKLLFPHNDPNDVYR